MPEYRTKRKVRHSSRDMFDLVADVEKYPEFLPLCEGLVVRSRKDGGEGKSLLVADMTVGYKSIRETFTTQVLLKPADYSIDVKYLDGPFRYLDNRWQFLPAGDQADEQECLVDFYIDYAFKNRMLGMVMGSMFDRAFRMFAEAFEKRADEIYSSASSA